MQCSVLFSRPNDHAHTKLLSSVWPDDISQLSFAVQVSGQEYELWLSPDSSTNGHTQWYFFSIANGRAGLQYRLHIHNFRKAHSLYGQGLQPLLHSSKEAALTVSHLYLARSMHVLGCFMLTKALHRIQEG